MRRTSGVIVYLAQGGRHSSYGRDSVKLLRSSVQRLVDNYLGTHKDDVLFFHFGDVPDNVQHELVALCGFDVNARFLMAPSNYTTVPPGTPPASKWVHAKKFSAGYRHMIRLYTIGIWPILAEEGYEYVMRLDEDSFILSPVPYNIFNMMRSNNIDYAYRLASWELVPGKGYPFHMFLNSYLRERQSWLTPTWLLDSCANRSLGSLAYTYENCGDLYGFYNNFFVTRVGFWLQDNVQDWLRHADASHAIYTQRWGDILWQSAAVQMFMPVARVRMLHDFAYEHATYLKIRNGTAVEEAAFTINGSIRSKRRYASSRCVFYGGLALGTSRSDVAESRLQEMMAMPACRERSFRRTVVRPCLLLDDVGRGDIEAHATLKPRALLVGSISEQEAHCSKPEPRPFHCRLASRSPFGWANTKSAAENMRRNDECICAPGLTTRSSIFSICYCDALSRVQAQTPRDDWVPSRQWGCPDPRKHDAHRGSNATTARGPKIRSRRNDKHRPRQLLDAGNDADQLGRVAIVHVDNRYCAHTQVNADHHVTPAYNGSHVCRAQVNVDAFWWMTAAINHAWARVHGYTLLLYCIPKCVHPDSGERRSPQWCKLIALAHTLNQGFETVLFFDSDAHWKQPLVSMYDGLVSKYATELLSSRTAPTMFFGCNSPWDVCGIRWNFSAVHGQHGSACSGLMLLRNDRRTHLVLRDWWHARSGWARPQQFRRKGTCSDQAVLWRMWSTRPDLAASMQVFSQPSTSSSHLRRSGKNKLPVERHSCMRVVGNRQAQRDSPVHHMTSFNPSYRSMAFSETWNATRPHHDADWCVRLHHLDGPAVAKRLFGRVDAFNRSSTWFDNTPYDPIVSDSTEMPTLPLVCAKGILHDVANVCCDAACGSSCGGPQCAQSGSSRCCVSEIMRRDRKCKSASDVACVLPWVKNKKPSSSAPLMRARKKGKKR